MKHRNGWCYAFWILIIVVLILALAVGLIAWAGSGTDDEDDTNTESSATISSVSVTPAELSLDSVGATGTITADVTMTEGAYEGAYSWSSDDFAESVIEMTSSGDTATVTAVANGTANVTVTVGEGSDAQSATCVVTVAIPEPATVTSVSLSDASVEYGSSATLTATVKMSDNSDYEGDYTWSSDNPDIAAVSGEITTENFVTVSGVKCGTATITVSVGEGDDAKTAACEVTVSEDHAAAEAGRITGSADVAADYHFMFDVEYDEGTTVVFDDSSVSEEYDAETKTYTLSGLSGKMTTDQATAFWGETDASDHESHEYIGFIVNVNEGETVKVESYSSTAADATPDKTFTFDDPTEDTSFLVDIADHDEDGVCTWYNVLTVTYAGGDVETYTVVLGDIYTPASTQDDLFAAVAAGGDVALTQDITLATDYDDNASGNHTQKAAATLTIGNGTDEIEVTLDLNGYTLLRRTANSSGYQYNTIEVKENATLIVTDSSEDGGGVVDVIGNYNECLYNKGTVVLEGGLFTRSNENGMVESSNGGDSSYTIENYGDLTIDGATVYNAGDYSTCIRNQYTSDSSNPATLTMKSGKVYGGKYAVGSGSSTANRYATFTMTGGTLGGLRSETDALPYRALNNYDQAIITGGTLLGGNGGAIDVGGANKADACVEGVVIFNEDGGTNHTLTIGDGNGNGPEIIYEGINPNAETDDDGNQPEGANLTYYEEEETIPAFATGIAVYSGEVDINAGSISCTDTAEDRDYNFMGVYMTNGTLRVSGGTISGDEAIVIDFTVETDAKIAYEISGGTLVGGIKIYGEDGKEVDASAYEPGDVVVPGSDENFTFNEGTFDGFSGLDEDNLTITDESGNEVTYVAGGITVTEIVGSDGTITVVVDGIVANQMSDEQKVAFDASYATDAEGTIRFYIAVKIAVKPGETVTVTAGEKPETIPNDTDEVIYDLWVIEISQTHFSSVTSPTDDYLSVDLSSFTMSVSVTASDNSTATYTIAFGNVFVPLQAWKCASDQHTVSNWTVAEEATCSTAGSKTGTCDYCGETVKGVIPATGLHAATAYDGTYYAVYCADSEAWCALCETCGQWFEIEKCETCDIYDFILLTCDEASLNAAIKTARERTDGSDTNRTQILVYGTITISDDSYVKIDCDNVEIYGLGADSSKIIDSVYEEDTNSGTARDGVEISGKNVTIRNLTIDGSKLDESTNHYNLEHGLEIREDAENVTISNCVIIGGTSSGSSAVVLVGSNDSGYVLIENCTLSGYRGLMIERNDGDKLDVTISGGTINGLYYGIHTEGLADVHTNGVCLVAENATINGKNSLGSGDSFTFTNCTFGFGVYNGAAYGSMNTYCDVTLTGCTFLSNGTGYENTSDTLVNTSSNYVIQARVEGVTISLIDCEFVNTYENGDLNTGTLAVTADNFVYLVGGKSSVKNCYLYFDDSDDAVKYFYDATEHTVTEYTGEESDGDDGGDGTDDGDENP